MRKSSKFKQGSVGEQSNFARLLDIQVIAADGGPLVYTVVFMLKANKLETKTMFNKKTQRYIFTI